MPVDADLWSPQFDVNARQYPGRNAQEHTPLIGRTSQPERRMTRPESIFSSSSDEFEAPVSVPERSRRAYPVNVLVEIEMSNTMC